ncbi:MAG: hypothetical protein HOQ05_10835 [Corynebacteriales bacterium]|nr:hypothetical protein [Mycobacteriales bacterium]
MTAPRRNPTTRLTACILTGALLFGGLALAGCGADNKDEKSASKKVSNADAVSKVSDVAKTYQIGDTITYADKLSVTIDSINRIPFQSNDGAVPGAFQVVATVKNDSGKQIDGTSTYMEAGTTKDQPAFGSLIGAEGPRFEDIPPSTAGTGAFSFDASNTSSGETIYLIFSDFDSDSESYIIQTQMP